MATSNVNKMEHSFSIDIESVVGGVSINEVHEIVDDLNHSVVINTINEELGNLFDLSDERCIYKVPETFRCFNPKAYTPKILSIGPIHHGNKEFKRMEEIKKRFLKSFLNRRINNKCLEDYVEIIMKREERLRAAYLEPIEFKSHEFVKIIMLDAAFIIEFLLRKFFPDLNTRLIDLHFYPERMLSEVDTDLLLLENQIPFFILQDLFDPIDDNATGIVIKGKKLTIYHLFYKFFKNISCFKNKPISVTSEAKHCLDFMRILYKPSTPLEKESTKNKESTDDWVQIPTITELHQAGVEFKAISSENLFAISFDFNSGVLKLPSLTIHTDFEERIRNLMAYEQCHHHIEENNICDYAILMDDLINTSRDVDFLVKYGIIVNALGDNSKICDLFNNIGKGIYGWEPRTFYFVKTKEDMINYCKNPINRWKASLKQNYFNNPWRTASVVAAILLLLLTIIQAVTSVMSLV